MDALFLSNNQSMMRPKPAISRNVTIALAVVLMHIGFIWGLYSGLLMRAVELVVPVVVLSQFINPPAPKIKTPPPPPPPPAQVKKASTAPSVAAPQPLAIADPTPSPIAPSGVTTPQQAPALVPTPATVASPIAAVAPSPAAAPALQLPSSDADYLQNPKPAYPSLSRRLNEQGRTTVRVLIGADGQPQRAEIAKSSGFTRLDEAALATVMRWRYVPGKRGGAAVAMWFNVPIHWVLE